MKTFNDHFRFCHHRVWIIPGVTFVVLLGGFLAGCDDDSDSPVTPDPTVTPEPIQCDGVAVGGACWYYGEIGDSCDDVCALHGGYDDRTRTYAGSAGTDSQCMQVLEALQVLEDTDGQLTVYSEDQGLGCHVWEIALGTEGLRAQWNRSLTPTTPQAASADPWMRRACVCQQ